ncbi:low temperature requirement protein A [Agreia sp.]|uniref:low temperature requirement protein A n=1 Tax=Agreia sp. TaxID=1872416 RepID=UPI0035BC8914
MANEQHARSERTSRILGSVRVATGDHPVTQFELFFDLVFVFAFTQVTQTISHDHSMIDVLQAMIILGLLWWSWVAYAWLGNQAFADRGTMPLSLAGAASLMFVVGFAIPQAFAEEGGPRPEPFVLVAAYVGVRIVNVALYLVAARDDICLKRQLLLTSAIAVAPMTVLLVIGAVLGGPAQAWFWLAALLYDAAAVFFTSRRGDFRVTSPAHAAERFGLVVILALGESTISTGVGLRDVPVDALSIAAVFLVVAGNFIIWWTYFHRFSPAVHAALAALTGRFRLDAATHVYTFGHFPIVAGIILTAAGIESTIAHIGDTEPLGLFGALSIGAGGSVVLATTAAIWYRMTKRILLVRLIVAALFLPASILAAQLLPIVFLVVFVAGGAVVVVVEARTKVLHTAADLPT